MLLILFAIYGLFVIFIAKWGFLFMFNPPSPKIKYGEFPFRLTYEINGEQKVIEDTIICKFDGFKSEGTNGIHRKWKTYLKSGNERLTLLDLRSLEEVNEFRQTMLELYFYYGNAEYYMGDIGDRQRSAQGLDRVSYHYQNTDGTTGGSSYKVDEAYEKYKIRLISWEPSPPIQNTFK